MGKIRKALITNWAPKRCLKLDPHSIDIYDSIHFNPINQSTNEVFIYLNTPLCQETCYSLLIWKRKSMNNQLKGSRLIPRFILFYFFFRFISLVTIPPPSMCELSLIWFYEEGHRGTQPNPPPPRPKISSFHAVFGKIWPNNRLSPRF